MDLIESGGQDLNLRPSAFESKNYYCLTVNLKLEAIRSFLCMNLKNILKTTGALHIVLGLLIIFLLIFSLETIAGNASSETLLLVRGTADVVAASNLGIGFLLIICSSIKDKKSLKKVLLGELALMACLLAVALFNMFNAGTIVDGGPPPPFWVVLIVNPILCIYGLVK